MEKFDKIDNSYVIRIKSGKFAGRFIRVTKNNVLGVILDIEFVDLPDHQPTYFVAEHEAQTHLNFIVDELTNDNEGKYFYSGIERTSDLEILPIVITTVFEVGK